MTTKCPAEEWEEICEIAATDEGAYSEPALKQIPNLKNPTNQHGKSGTKTHFAIAAFVTNGNPVGCQICHLSDKRSNPVDDDDDDTADINATDSFRLVTVN